MILMGIGKNCFLFAKPIKGNWRLIILYVVKIGLFSLMEDTSPLRCYSLWLGKEKEVECLQTGPTTLFVQPSGIRKYGTLFKKAEKVPMCCSAKGTKIQNVFLSSSPLSQLTLLFLNMLLNVLHRDTFKMRGAAHWHSGPQPMSMYTHHPLAASFTSLQLRGLYAVPWKGQEVSFPWHGPSP